MNLNPHDKLRIRMDSLSYLPSATAVALKFIELGRDPEAAAGDYVEVISADPSLSSKLLALANSSWFGVRHSVTNIKIAISLLGLGTVRSLAIGYWVTSMHSGLKLEPQESRMFWMSSLCKAIAAKHLAKRWDDALGETAFAIGMLQDLSVTLLYAVAKERELAILTDPEVDCQAQLQRERDLFRMDHTEAGRVLARKLELPTAFVDAIGLHHNVAGLREMAEHEAIAKALHASSLFPHILDGWNRKDAGELEQSFANDAKMKAGGARSFLDGIQAEFDRMCQFFEDGQASGISVVGLFEGPTRSPYQKPPTEETQKKSPKEDPSPKNPPRDNSGVFR
ncbi:MAG: HDOD domain-containing protein [Phycisphaerae bacterium]|nr:HDOD domain-containing protein [Phycisphaerae bacterium]